MRRLAELFIPVLDHGFVIGTLDIESDEIGAFDGDAMCWLERCVDALAGLWDGD